MRYKPFIRVNIGDNPVNDIFYQRLMRATITDNAGNQADTFEAVFNDAGNDLELPQKDDPISVTFGYLDDYSQVMGKFVVETVSASGGRSGEQIRICGHSADMRKDIKEEGSEHYDNMDIGAIVGKISQRYGYEAKISEELASIKLPYIARINQSPIDFLTRLADRVRGTFLVKDGKFLFLQRGQLPAITIAKSDCSEWDLGVAPRGRYGEVQADYFDRSSGKKCTCSHKTGLAGPARRLRICYSTKEEAEAACASEGDRLCRSTGNGSITLAGNPAIMADQPLELTGFRLELNGLWRAGTVTHTYDRSGYWTEISFEAPEDGKGQKAEKSE
ncbi:phage late control D family protein [Candidatus Tokpelaia sp.]|uniref:phage late control D family protein n=1 Tax=Candidatus Tokpelaia sp. TaxID=2233777 RepID=UPI00123A85D0|nr:late control protein [Candidatus Tokpelaia sp.]KAA6405680.1 late control protein [Candidatus Tokpelaia sp.]